MFKRRVAITVDLSGNDVCDYNNKSLNLYTEED